MQRAQQILNCQIDGHYQSPIIGVCVNKECQNKRPFCVGCQYQFHNTHIGDLKCFDDLKNWFSQNSQIVEDLKNYLNDLNGLVKKISNLIEATSQRDIYQNFQVMYFTDLHNSINNQITLQNNYKNMWSLLQEMFSTTARNKIKNICTEKQTNFSGQIDPNLKKSIQVQDYQKGVQELQNNRYNQINIQVNQAHQNLPSIQYKSNPQNPLINLTKNFQPQENFVRQNKNFIQQDYDKKNQLVQNEHQKFPLQNQIIKVNTEGPKSKDERTKTPNTNQNEKRVFSPIPQRFSNGYEFSQNKQINYQK